MKIGMVTAVYHPVVNGVTNMIALYKERLEQLGHEVTVFTLGDAENDDMANRIIRSPAIPIGDQGYQIGVRYTREARERAREMDVLHCHHIVFGVGFAHRYGNCPVVLTNHTRHDLYTSAYLPIPQTAADALMHKIWPEYAAMADVVIAPSESVREVLLRFGVPEPVVVIPNGVDLDRFYHPSNPKSKAALGLAPSDVLAIYTGRLADEKNLTTLLAQFAVALDIVPQLKLLLVGDGPARGELLAQARELDISDAVHFYGSETYSSMPDILAAADIYITASVTEVHPLALIEAMAVGLPVVASRSPGIIETVEHGVSGLLAGQPQSGLAAAITPLASNGDLRRKMARAAREASRAYAISVTVQSTVELYERLCLERPDLLREQRHGRWFRPYERLKPQIKRFASKIGFDEGAYTLSGQDVDE